MPGYDVYSRLCPTRLVLDRIADKWSMLVLGRLRRGPRPRPDGAPRHPGERARGAEANIEAVVAAQAAFDAAQGQSQSQGAAGTPQASRATT